MTRARAAGKSYRRPTLGTGERRRPDGCTDFPRWAPLDYAACWEDQDEFRRIGGNYTRQYVEHELWPWLKQRGFADEGDDTVLGRFLDDYIRLPAQMRPGLRFRRVWTAAEAPVLGSTLADAIRSDFDAVFTVAYEPALSSAGPADQHTESSGLGAPYRQVIELSGSRDPFSSRPPGMAEIVGLSCAAARLLPSSPSARPACGATARPAFRGGRPGTGRRWPALSSLWTWRVLPCAMAMTPGSAGPGRRRQRSCCTTALTPAARTGPGRTGSGPDYAAPALSSSSLPERSRLRLRSRRSWSRSATCSAISRASSTWATSTGCTWPAWSSATSRSKHRSGRPPGSWTSGATRIRSASGTGCAASSARPC